MSQLFQTIGLIAAVTLPLWNIPLIVRVIRRKSSKDISIVWVVGVWTSFALMAPSGFASTDTVWRVFNIVNLLFFTCVMITVLKYRNGDSA